MSVSSYMLYMFDFDGTIVDNKGIFRYSFVNMLKEYKKDFDEEEVMNKSYGTFLDMINGFHQEFFSEMEQGVFHDEYRLACTKSYVLLQPKPYFLDFYNKIKKDKVVIATRNDRRVICAWLEVNKLDIEVISEADIQARKDDDSFYEKMSQRYNVTKDEMVIFEDDARNLSVAFNNKVKTVCVTNRQNEEDLEIINKVANVIIDDYKELSEKGL